MVTANARTSPVGLQVYYGQQQSVGKVARSTSRTIARQSHLLGRRGMSQKKGEG